MIIDIIKDAILQNIGPLKQAPKGWNKRHCMLCNTQGHGKDTRNRFGIQFNSQSIVVHCFNCSFKAVYTEGHDLSKSFKFFLSNLNLDEKFIKQIEFEVFKQRNNIQTIRDGASATAEDIENKFKLLFQKWKQMPLPDGSLSITEWLEHDLADSNFLNVVNYAIGRDLLDLDQFYWSPSTQFNLNHRLIIPYIYRGKIVGFSARLHYDVLDKSVPKYYQQCPPDFVYNMDHQDGWSRKYVIVTEGVLDAWVTDGISILGEVSQPQIDIINRLQKQIIVCPDRDKKGGDLVEAAIHNNWAVSFPKWSKGIKDAAKAAEKYGRLLTTHSIISSAVSGKDNIHVKWGIEQNARKRQRD